MLTTLDIGSDRVTLTHKGQGYTLTDSDTLRIRLGRIAFGPIRRTMKRPEVHISYDLSNFVHHLAAEKIKALCMDLGLPWKVVEVG